ncbi:SAM-dependent methyltransferase [Mycobacterium sp. AZCC_0083]|uniref:SAM-dependent methyltransferase n=1 Tax=Mycobacterium sp. AZCC_0083 TaxID=2735882 RepID=UPI001614ABE5|nr:class I SAM-dependent methyltransferase [Mycobacterium sp. AZCC_0083]MBB5164422.1 methyltransferase (TIGR00027 family) [Mycobacterium sp. AZCC_0083]
MARTDGDTWDLASSVGATATAVAAFRAIASQGPDALLDDPWADPLVRAVGIDTFVKLVDGETTATAETTDPLVSRAAMREQMTVRTRFFDDFFTTGVAPATTSGQATDSGVRQAVILASGLDTRAYRLAWPAGTVVYEIDQPDVIEFKTRTLAGLGAHPTAQRRTIAIDLRDDWPAALLQAGFITSVPTVWSAEGLLAYLPPEAQDRLFDNITDLSAPGSRVASEYMDMRGLPSDWAEQLTERSKRLGSTVNLAELIYTGERNDAADYLKTHGWQVGILGANEAHAANGFEPPDNDMRAFGGNYGYLSATLN